MMSFGFLTFGSSTLGVVLNNYSPLDTGARLCRMLMAVSIVGSYPFVFGGMKRGYFDLIKHEPTSKQDKVREGTADRVDECGPQAPRKICLEKAGGGGGGRNCISPLTSSAPFAL